MEFAILNIQINQQREMRDAKVWSHQCPVKFEDLKLLKILHYDFVGNVKLGDLIVHHKISSDTLKIFQELFMMKFPIESIIPIEHFKGNDTLSMQVNNSSAFNFRNIDGSKEISMHSYGLAIDINPVQNPYLILQKTEGTVKIHPEQGVDFLNRNNIRAGMIEDIVPIFKKYGFIWGGGWNSPIDYHHFQMPRNFLIK